MKRKVLYPLLCAVLVLIIVFSSLYVIDNKRMSESKSVLFSTWGAKYTHPVESYSAIMCSAKSFDGEFLEIVLDDGKNTTVKIAVKKESLIEKLSEMRLESIIGVQTKSFLPNTDITAMFHNAEVNTVQLLTEYEGYEKYFEIIDISTYHKPSFVGKIIEETTSYMIVEPIENKADAEVGDKVKVEYSTDHNDYLYGIGRVVVIYYYPDELEENTDDIVTIRSDDISTEGFREFELEVEPSVDRVKRLVLSGVEIADFASREHLNDTDLYYYGLDNVMITIKGFTMPLEYAIEKGRITLDGIVARCNQEVADGALAELIYKDGGSQVYKYPEYTIIKYHTLDGNHDVYIGSTDMDINIADK